MLAALAIYNIFLNWDDGFDLRSRCQLIPTIKPELQIVNRTAEDVEPLSADTKAARAARSFDRGSIEASDQTSSPDPAHAPFRDLLIAASLKQVFFELLAVDSMTFRQVSSAARTGVLPRLMLYFGPRTELAWFNGRIPPGLGRLVPRHLFGDLEFATVLQVCRDTGSAKL